MKIIQKITSVFLAGIFLFSSLGFTISSMVCLKSGKGKISFAMIEDCCTKKKEINSIEKTDCCDDEQEQVSTEQIAVIKKSDCCDISNLTLKLTDFQNSQKLSVEQPAVFQSLFSSLEPLSAIKAENKSAFQYSNLPPPFYGRVLLNFISVLTI